MVRRIRVKYGKTGGTGAECSAGRSRLIELFPTHHVHNTTRTTFIDSYTTVDAGVPGECCAA